MPTINIHNDTKIPLNIALAQITPLYWENNVAPGSSITRYPGQVWFTIRAFAYNEGDSGQQYSDMDNVIPITAMVVAPVALVLGAAAAVEGAAVVLLTTQTENWPIWLLNSVKTGEKAAQYGNLYGVGPHAGEGIAALVRHPVVSSAGWYMVGEKSVHIRGGPDATVVDGKVFINFTEGGFPPFTVDY